jgi:prepilin-type N-terminal cleavage/methylation domain-containing protein
MERDRSGGFTLIELLIVVVIIGILAAIAIPRFTATKTKAFDGAARSDLRNAMTAQEAYYADYNTYASDVTDLQPFFTQTVNVTTTVTSGDISGFEMTSAHATAGAKSFCVNSDVGEIVEGTTC